MPAELLTMPAMLPESLTGEAENPIETGSNVPASTLIALLKTLAFIA
jgi:hypothetical protein